MALNVPISFTSEGITLVVFPPCTEHIESTDGETGFLLREIICCKLIITCDAIKIVSGAKCGDAA